MRQNKDDSKQLKTATIQYNYTKRVMANKEMGNGDGVTLEERKKQECGGVLGRDVCHGG